MYLFSDIFLTLAQILIGMPTNKPWVSERWLPGVLNKRQLISLCDSNLILGVDISKIENDASSLDLHLSSESYKLKRGSIKPFKKNYQKILSDNYYAEKQTSLTDGSLFY